MATALNTEIQRQLEKYHCVRGHLRYQPKGLAFNGQRPDGQPVLLWQTTPLLGKLIDRYLEGQPGAAGVEIDIDLEKGTFDYHPITAAALQKEERQAKAEAQQEIERATYERRLALEERKEKYGAALAERVADALLRGELGYHHRDYCGMGLRFADGIFQYGEIWDGDLTSPRKFNDRLEFISWLAAQSDASLARLEEKDPWYWGNQVINREALEKFAGLR